MTPERWKQVSQLYQATRARRVSQRTAFLALHRYAQRLTRELSGGRRA
jgi:hypothetical protein